MSKHSAVDSLPANVLSIFPTEFKGTRRVAGKRFGSSWVVVHTRCDLPGLNDAGVIRYGWTIVRSGDRPTGLYGVFQTATEALASGVSVLKGGPA